MGMQKDSTNESGLSDLLADMVNHYQYPAADTAMATLTSGTETTPIVSTVAAEQLVSLAASETATTVPVAEKKPKPASYTTEINKPETR
ncbi:hypothetical protein [Snodgrassella communis]|uniref:hypothetical protein n=1 Tax=Snodgrassella communis TaxID=2946699 RepID=UPI000C1F4816|nr:hypothetical protein [Snodgrassella communis]PIT22732.1 hypothetical protein BGI35_04000 [Snodgrassella communis]